MHIHNAQAQDFGSKPAEFFKASLSLCSLLLENWFATDISQAPSCSLPPGFRPGDFTSVPLIPKPVMDAMLSDTWKVKSDTEMIFQQNLPISLVPAFSIDKIKDIKFSVRE